MKKSFYLLVFAFWAVAVNGAPIHDALRAGDDRKVKKLLRSGVDVNVRGDEGQIPLHCAVGTGNVKMVKYLTKKGSDLTAKCKCDMTPCEFAKKRKEGVLKEGDTKMVKKYDDIINYLEKMMSRR